MRVKEYAFVDSDEYVAVYIFNQCTSCTEPYIMTELFAKKEYVATCMPPNCFRKGNRSSSHALHNRRTLHDNGMPRNCRDESLHDAMFQGLSRDNKTTRLDESMEQVWKLTRNKNVVVNIDPSMFI